MGILQAIRGMSGLSPIQCIIRCQWTKCNPMY